MTSESPEQLALSQDSQVEGSQSTDAQAASAQSGAQSDAAAKKKPITSADVFKFAGLIAFFLIMAVIIYLMWPLFGELFEPGGTERVITQVREAGVGGVFILLAIQFLQVVVAFIPGEVVQIAAGMLYGPWLGALVIFIGCIFSSAVVFLLVHKLGAPFVQAMVPEKQMEKFRKFEKSRKFNSVVFILFLIPGMPKDVFTYITPLSDMRFTTFMWLTNLARIPGIVVSTYAADGLAEGNITESVIIFAVLAVVAVLALIFYNRIINWIEPKTKHDFHKLSELDEKTLNPQAARIRKSKRIRQRKEVRWSRRMKRTVRTKLIKIRRRKRAKKQ